MKRSYVQVNGVLYEKGTEPLSDAPLIMPDIQPYKSMIDGSMITSRSQHRAHLRQHGCQEIGDQTHYLKPPSMPDVNPEGRKELIRAQIDAMDHKTYKRALQRDIDNWKWNSRK
jgi:hypothetical protein